MKLQNVFFALIFLSSLFLLSCSSAIRSITYPALNDGKYDTEFPYKNASAELEEIVSSTKLLSTIAFYKSYIFHTDSDIKRSDITDDLLDDESTEITFFEKHGSGTATIIYADGGKAVFLTCAHIVNYPDTIITYISDKNGAATSFVQSISIKARQSNFIAEYSDLGDVEILAADDAYDLAILGFDSGLQNSGRFKKLSYPFGNSSELEWGTFVYVIGFPMNHKMISRGIVSKPSRGEGNIFLLDAVFSPGFSGGLVLAMRDGVPNFEVVGLVKSVPGEFQDMVVPKDLKPGVEYNPRIPYTGKLFAERRLRINYGITFAITIERIKEFIESNKDELQKKGFFIETSSEI